MQGLPLDSVVRTVLPLLITFCLVANPLAAPADPSADDILALEGNALFKAVDEIGYSPESKFSTTELIRLADKLRKEAKGLAKDDENRGLFGRFFTAACGKAKGHELAQLIEIYAALEPGSFDKNYEFQPLATAWILHELESRTEWPKIELPPLESAVPQELENAPKDLVAAWKLYKRSRQKADRSFRDDDAQKQSVSFQANERTFYRLIDEVLRKQRSGLAEELAAFGWSGTCGTGSESFSNPQSIGIFMALLVEGRLPEAVGATVKIQSERPLASADGQKDVRLEFLRKCGIDWEEVFAGAQVESDLHSINWSTPYLQALAAFGSERAASLLSQMAAIAKPEMREAYANALSAFIPTDPDAISWSSRTIDRRVPQTISYDLRLRLLEILQDFAKPDAPADVVDGALVGLGRAKSLATKPTLRALLKHPSARVTEEAGRILRALGEDVPTSPIEPSRFRIFLNGVPAGEGLKVGWEVKADSGTVSNTVETDETGTIKVPSEHLLGAQRVAGTMIISSTNVLSPPEAASYLVTLPVPKDLDKITRVDAAVWPVELRIERPRPRGNGVASKASVKLQRHEPKHSENSSDYVSFDRMEKEFEFALDTLLPLSLQSGAYDVEILASGAERFKATFEAGPNARGVKAELKPGGDLHVEIVRPDGERGARASLFSKGSEMEDVSFDYQNNTYRGLPVGSYVLHIPSSAEIATKDSYESAFTPIQGYAGKDIPFTISGDTPLLDLGEVDLEAAQPEAVSERR